MPFTVLIFSGYGFNSGSALLLGVDDVGFVAATAAVNTALGGAAGGVTALLSNFYLEERRTGEPTFSLHMCMNGCLSGLVAITASCGVVEPWAAVVIGMVAGWVYMHASSLLIRFRIDDAVDAIPVHMFGGAWGVFAVGLFASPRRLIAAYDKDMHVGLFYSFHSGSFNAALLASQICEILFIMGWTVATMFPFFLWLNYVGWLRADSLEELVGLDISYHGGPRGSALDGVKKEYVEAYNRHKGNIRNRRSKNRDADNGWLSTGTDVSGGKTTITAASSNVMDPEVNQEAAAEEALRESNV